VRDARRYLLSLVSERAEPTGIGTYGLEVARAMGPLLEADERLVIVRHAAGPACAGPGLVDVALPGVAATTARRRLAEQTLVPALALRHQATLVHSLNYVVPEAWRGASLLTLNDDRLQRERAEGSPLARAAARVFAHSVRRATRLLAISTTTAARCAATFGVARERFAVTPLAVDHAAIARVGRDDQARVRAALALGDRPVVLFVGELEAHKNVDRLVAAFGRARAQAPGLLLVLAGGRGARREALTRQAHELGLAEAVRFTPYLERPDLLALVTSARVLALPSLDEGFGLPVVEGFAAGTPVLASDRGALPETAGGAAELVDPEDVAAIADGLARLLLDEALRARRIEAGRRRALDFTWERSAAAVLAVYRSVADAREAGRRGRPDVAGSDWRGY